MNELHRKRWGKHESTRISRQAKSKYTVVPTELNMELPHKVVKLVGKFRAVVGDTVQKGEHFDFRRIIAAIHGCESVVWFSSLSGMIAHRLLEKGNAMTSLMKAVAGVMRAMRKAAAALVWFVIQVGDRLISVLRPAPMPMVDQLEPAMPTEVDQARAAGEEAAVRNLAAIVMRGGVPGPEHFAAAGEKASEWVAVLDDAMLKKVVMATNAELRDHMRGRKTIRGLLYYDEETVNEWRIAGLREKAREIKAALVSPRYA